MLSSYHLCFFTVEPTPPVQVHTVGSTDEEITRRFTGPGDKNTIKYETSLLQDILGNYSSGMRPVQSSKMPAIIQFDLRLNKLVKLVSGEKCVYSFTGLRDVDFRGSSGTQGLGVLMAGGAGEYKVHQNTKLVKNVCYFVGICSEVCLQFPYRI